MMSAWTRSSGRPLSSSSGSYSGTSGLFRATGEPLDGLGSKLNERGAAMLVVRGFDFCSPEQDGERQRVRYRTDYVSTLHLFLSLITFKLFLADKDLEAAGWAWQLLLVSDRGVCQQAAGALQ